MKLLEDAMMEIKRARSDVDHTDVRTQLESITTSLQEMLDTEAGDLTEGDVAFGEEDFAGAAPSADNLSEVEKSLDKLADNTEQEEVVNRLESARDKVASYRAEKERRE